MSHFPALFEFPPGQTLNLLAYSMERSMTVPLAVGGYNLQDG